MFIFQEFLNGFTTFVKLLCQLRDEGNLHVIIA